MTADSVAAIIYKTRATVVLLLYSHLSVVATIVFVKTLMYAASALREVKKKANGLVNLVERITLYFALFGSLITVIVIYLGWAGFLLQISLDVVSKSLLIFYYLMFLVGVWVVRILDRRMEKNQEWRQFRYAAIVAGIIMISAIYSFAYFTTLFF